MKKIILNFFFFYSVLLLGQVGINTETPKADLHINGSLQLTNMLLIGGDASTIGFEGNEGQILTSGGENKTAKWEDHKKILVLPVVVANGLVGGIEPDTGILTGETITIIGNSNINSQNYTTVKYNFLPKLNNFLNANYLSYDADLKVFTVLVKGYYRIYTSVSTLVTESTPTAGIFESKIVTNRNGILSTLSGMSSFHHERTPLTSHVSSGIEYFDVGDKISVQFRREVTVQNYSGNITILYTGIVNE